MSLLADTAQAVVDALNAGAFSQALKATRGYRPEFELREMDRLHVTVVPGDMAEERFDRQHMEFSPKADVAVQKKVDVGNVAEIDALMDLTQEIADFLRDQPLTLADGSQARWAGAEWSTPYAPEELKARHLFVAVLTLTYAVVR